MKGALIGLLRRLAGLLPVAWIEAASFEFLASRVVGLPPREALCLLFRLDQRLYDLQGRMAVAYGGGVHAKLRFVRYQDFFVGRVKAGERVLDVGCGPGHVSHAIATRSGARVLGIDKEPSVIEVARERFRAPGVDYLVGAAPEDLPEGGFDVVILSNVLEHLPERSRFLRELMGKTQARRYLLRVPLFERDWRVPLKREVGAEWRLDPTHETEYTLESFAGEMAAAGLEVVHQEVRWGEIWAEARPRETDG